MYKVLLESLKEEVELSSVSKYALYKRWERLKKGKLRNILQDVSPEEMRAFVEKFLSEICRKMKLYTAIQKLSYEYMDRYTALTGLISTML